MQKRKKGGVTGRGGAPWGSSASAPPGASDVRACVSGGGGETRGRGGDRVRASG